MDAEIFPDLNPDTAKTWKMVQGDWRRPALSSSYRLIWDDTRSFGQLWPRPTPDEIEEFYRVDDYYTHSSRPSRTGERQTRTFGQKLLMKFAWLADRGVEPDIEWWKKTLGPSRLSILEIGCGNGSNLKTFEQFGHDVTGVEPDATARQVAAERGLRVFPGTAEDLPEAVSSTEYDVIVFMHVLEHCLRPDAAIQNARNLLHKGGKIVAEVPNNACTAAEFFGTTWYWLDVPRHVNFFTTKSLQNLLSKNGIRPAQTFYRGYCRHFSPAWMSTQALIGDRISSDDARRSGSDYWRYLIRSAFASADRKYDSVRVVGSTDEAVQCYRDVDMHHNLPGSNAT